jgi:hypothetical protein
MQRLLPRFRPGAANAKPEYGVTDFPRKQETGLTIERPNLLPSGYAAAITDVEICILEAGL